MKVNRGKDFESAVKEGFEKIPNTSVYRIPDQMSYRSGSKNPCDFLVYHRPNLYALECKSVYGNTLPFSNVSEYQWTELLKMSRIPGVVAGVLCWYIEHDRTIFIPIQFLEVLKQNGAKSIRYDADKMTVRAIENNNFTIIEIPGKKKRILWEYQMDAMFQTISSLTCSTIKEKESE